MPTLADQLADAFGAESDLAPEAVARFYRSLDSGDVPASWVSLFGFSSKPMTTRQRKRLSSLLGSIDEAPARARFFFALHSYLALVLKLCARRAIGVASRQPTEPLERTTLIDIEEGRWFQRRAGVENLGGDDPFGWYVDASLEAVWAVASDIERTLEDMGSDVFERARHEPTDLFKVLYEALIPRTVRRSLGEHYTPNWLAEHLVKQLHEHLEPNAGGSVLDPSCGSGTFLLEVLRRGVSAGESPVARWESIAGIDLNPLAVLAARVNLLVAAVEFLDEAERVTLPIHYGDALAEGVLQERQFDVVVGNPPWINWQGLPDPTRTRLQPLWEQYGLFVHEGFDTILGKGKKEFATLFTAVVVDRFLVDGGTLAFVMTQGVWKAAGASEGFRSLDFGGQFRLRIEHVEDLSAFKVFGSATTRTTTFIATKGRPNEFPVDYVYWRRLGRRASLDTQGSVEDALAHAERVELAAEPYDEASSVSPWVTARPAAIRALRRLFGESAYQARQGVNTGGGNAVFWMRLLTDEAETDSGEPSVVEVENILKGAKRKVEQTRVALEERYLYPLVRGRDVDRWHAEGDRHILMVQDPETRSGVSEEQLRSTAPRTLAYLERFRGFLETRSLFRRYFTRGGEPTSAWWSMFGVGTYTMQPWKVVWAGQVATSLECAVVGSENGTVVLPDQTAYFVGLETAEQADFLCGLLNASPIRLLYRSFLYKHVSLSFIEVLDLPEYCPETPWMRQLAGVSREARLAAAEGCSDAVRTHQADANRLACEYWRIGRDERREIRESLERLS